MVAGELPPYAAAMGARQEGHLAICISCVGGGLARDVYSHQAECLQMIVLQGIVSSTQVDNMNVTWITSFGTFGINGLTAAAVDRLIAVLPKFQAA